MTRSKAQPYIKATAGMEGVAEISVLAAKIRTEDSELGVDEGTG
jgi:hypothetical protein